MPKETTMDTNETTLTVAADLRAAAADMEELNRHHEIEELKRKAAEYLRWATEMKEDEPKIAATMAGRGRRKLLDLAKLLGDQGDE
jgi:hypothetical protein